MWSSSATEATEIACSLRPRYNVGIAERSRTDPFLFQTSHERGAPDRDK